MAQNYRRVFPTKLSKWIINHAKLIKIEDIPEIPVFFHVVPFFPCFSMVIRQFLSCHEPVFCGAAAAEDLRRRLKRRAMGLGSAADAGDVGWAAAGGGWSVGISWKNGGLG